MDYKLYAALAYCRANKLNHNVIDSPHARFGIIASGKAYHDTRQALADLGLDEQTLQGHRHPPVQVRHGVAARGDRGSRVRRRSGRDPGRRGEAPVHRVPAEGRAVLRGSAPASACRA